MKHIEYASAEERAKFDLCSLQIAAWRAQIEVASAQKRAIAERCRARARAAKQGEK